MDRLQNSTEPPQELPPTPTKDWFLGRFQFFDHTGSKTLYSAACLNTKW